MSTSTSQAAEPSFLVYHGEQECGPYTQSQLLEMLQRGQIGRKDLVFYDGLMGWKPLEEVFEIEEQLSHFMNEGQDAAVVADLYRHLEPMLGHDESIYYIGHQRKKLMRQRPDAAVITNRRLVIMRHTLTGATLEDCQWRNVLSVHLKEGLMGTTFSVLDRNDHLIEIEDIPKEQIAHLCQLAQEMRE
ncbi:MAG: PH domain-containing protein [Verrucomicrobiales bacterium]